MDKMEKFNTVKIKFFGKNYKIDKHYSILI